MKYCNIFILFIVAAASVTCEHKQGETDYSGVYCLNIQNMEMTIVQNGNTVTFTLQYELMTNGTGTLAGDTLFLTADVSGENIFTSQVIFSGNGWQFSGPFQVKNPQGLIVMEGILLGHKGGCAKYDIEAHGIPQFIVHDFTESDKIEMISRFRSGFGHSYADGAETCRSMKHYFNPYITYRENNTVEIYSPVAGTIMLVLDDYEGANIGLKNKQIQIQPDDQPAFICIIFHCDLLSSAITAGKKVAAGELLGHACMYYEHIEMYVTSFDIALWVNTPSGIRLVPYFDAMTDEVFNAYIDRGVDARQDFTIPKAERDADPLVCDGEEFLTSGSVDNWVRLE